MSAVLSAVGNIMAGNAKANADQFNAEQVELQGRQERNVAIEKAQEQGVENERRQGAIVAAYGAAGVDPGAGSPLEVMADQATHGELNRQLMLWQGLAQQQSADSQGAVYRRQAKVDRNAGYVSALGSLASGTERLATAQGWVGPGFG